MHKHTGDPHHTAQSSGVDVKTFDNLYNQTRATGPPTQAAFVEAPQLTAFEGQTQAQVQASDFFKGVGPPGMGENTEGGLDLTGTAMVVG